MASGRERQQMPMTLDRYRLAFMPGTKEWSAGSGRGEWSSSVIDNCSKQHRGLEQEGLRCRNRVRKRVLSKAAKTSVWIEVHPIRDPNVTIGASFSKCFGTILPLAFGFSLVRERRRWKGVCDVCRGPIYYWLRLGHAEVYPMSSILSWWRLSILTNFVPYNCSALILEHHQWLECK